MYGERPVTELLKPEQRQLDLGKPWVCLFIHQVLPPQCPAQGLVQHSHVSTDPSCGDRHLPTPGPLLLWFPSPGTVHPARFWAQKLLCTFGVTSSERPSLPSAAFPSRALTGVFQVRASCFEMTLRIHFVSSIPMSAQKTGTFGLFCSLL